MKIKIDRNIFLSGLQVTQNIITQRATLPILSNYLLETKEGHAKLWVTSTDLEVGICSGISAEVMEGGSITVPAKKLGEILHSFSGNELDADINIELKDNNKVQLLGVRSKFQIAGTSKEDYPALPLFREEKAILFPGKVLLDMINKTIFSSSGDEARYVLNGALFSLVKGVATMVATDGRRLAAVRCRNLDGVGDRDFSVNIPSKALYEISKIITHLQGDHPGFVAVDISENQIGFKLGETTLFSRLIDGSFPNWEQVIPKRCEVKIQVNREALLGVTKRAALCITDKAGTCQYRFFKDHCEVMSKTAGHYEFEESISIIHMEGPDGFEVAFYPSHVTDFLKVVDFKEVDILFTTSVNPTLFQSPSNPDYFYVVMPTRPRGE